MNYRKLPERKKAAWYALIRRTNMAQNTGKTPGDEKAAFQKHWKAA
ncbi:MAG: hypothetical protein WBA83_03225 [Burkholderiaceae bacterium]